MTQIWPKRAIFEFSQKLCENLIFSDSKDQAWYKKLANSNERIEIKMRKISIVGIWGQKGHFGQFWPKTVFLTPETRLPAKIRKFKAKFSIKKASKGITSKVNRITLDEFPNFVLVCHLQRSATFSVDDADIRIVVEQQQNDILQHK